MHSLAPAAFAQTKPAVDLEAAIAKEQVDGDLATAIAAYRKIAANTSASRDVRSKALLHLAGCYEKLGRQALKVYRQIVRDFADQPAAAQARERLAALRQVAHPPAPVTMTQRKIETLGNGMGPGDTDGYRAVYRNDTTGELIFGDLAGKIKRVVFKAKLDDLPGWFPSRDFSIVGLRFYLKPNQPETYAVVNTDGTGYRELVKVDGTPTCGPPRWSWDNRYFLLCPDPKQGPSRLLRISVADGQIRELSSAPSGVIGVATFSPDGRFVAYQVFLRSGVDRLSQIFVLPIESGEPQQVYQERLSTGVTLTPQLLDWTADGRYLAIFSERTGKPALHLLPIDGGIPAGEILFLRYGDFESGITAAAGNLVYSAVKPGGRWSIHLAPLDSSGRPGAWKRLDLLLGNQFNPDVSWSGGSDRFAYAVTNEDVGETAGKTIHIHNPSTGEDRKIYRGEAGCKWAAQLPKLFCGDMAGIFSIALDTGEIERLQPFTTRWRIVDTSRDDRALYMFTHFGQGFTMARWDIAARQETILGQDPSSSTAWVARVSPDERFLMRSGERGIELRPTLGGDWIPLAPLGKEALAAGSGHYAFTPGGDWVLYHDKDSAGRQSLFRVSMAGGKPERLGDFPSSSYFGNLEISPDGRKIISVSGDYDTGDELWSLENFVPPPSRKALNAPRP